MRYALATGQNYQRFMERAFTPHSFSCQPAALAMLHPQKSSFRVGSQLTLCSLGGLLQLHEAASHFRSQLGSSLRTVCSTTDASELLLPGLLQGCMFPCPAIPNLTWGRLALG